MDKSCASTQVLGVSPKFLIAVYAGLMDRDERDRHFTMLVAQELVAQGKRRPGVRVRQLDIAAAMGVTAEHFSHVVNGRKGHITVGMLLRAADLLGMDPHVIVERAYAQLMSDPDAYALAARNDDDDDIAAAHAEDGF